MCVYVCVRDCVHVYVCVMFVFVFVFVCANVRMRVCMSVVAQNHLLNQFSFASVF